MNTLVDSLRAEFFQRALLEAILLGVLGGVVGVHVLLRRLPFFAVAMSHATFPGVVLASLMGVSLFLGGLVFGLLVALAVLVFGMSRLLDNASIVGVVLAGAFGLGVLLATASPDSGQHLTAYLVGSILTVERGDLLTTLLVCGGVGVLLFGLHKELVLSAFDGEGAAALGYRRHLLDAVALVVVTVSVVVMIPAVGTLLAVSLLTAPALTARVWVDRIGLLFPLAAIFGAISGVLGLVASALWNVAAGGAISLAAAGCFGLSLLLRRIVFRLRRGGI